MFIVFYTFYSKINQRHTDKDMWFNTEKEARTFVESLQETNKTNTIYTNIYLCKYIESFPN